MAECKGDVLTADLLACPSANTVVKTTIMKLVIVGVATCLPAFPKLQAVLLLALAAFITYWHAFSVSGGAG
jgi:hypothetical protein